MWQGRKSESGTVKGPRKRHWKSHLIGDWTRGNQRDQCLLPAKVVQWGLDLYYIPPKHILKEIGNQKINDKNFFSGSWQQTVQGNGLWERGHKKKRSAVTPLTACSVPRPHRGEWKPRQVLQVSVSLGDGDGSFWRPRQLELREEKYPEQELQRSAH